MDKIKRREESGEIDEQKWVHDSSFDHKGRIPLRSSTGVWEASLFIIVSEFSERLSYFGIATSLIICLTKVIHQDLKTAAKSVNYWSGITTLMPLLGGFLADAFLGRFSTVLVSSIDYLVIGAANFVSSLLITIVDHIAEKSCKSWFSKDLNSNQHDYFYWLLAIMTAINLCVYMIVARNYSYKNVHCKAAISVPDSNDRDDREAIV